ncbi:MAG: Stk1 family PASTA domain-containing Ser/Thr kinase [Acidimicrobiia bacterium]|nr:Stk1 family PASTA domain-containing Ser/Thr kinase [Acidimicrobiia bacterium]
MQPGNRLANRYELIRHLARGGMADVWEATDTLLGRRVAIKILHPQFATDDNFIARFRREAQSAANLSHPNIVSIFDWGEEGSLYFIVMELVEGKTLRDVIHDETGLMPRRAAEIAAEVSAALAVAHRAGLVHRDLKPANILLTPDGTAKVTDFGIALAWNDSQQLTKTGAVIGTATYFSPEQAQGQPLDERSDLYSLGVVLYEMLTGVPPFTGDSPVSVAYQHVSEPARLPSVGNPHLPPDIETIVVKAMDKVPDARYQTALEMREDLLLYIQGAKPNAAQMASAAAPTRVLTEMPAPTVPPDETYRQVASASTAANNRPFIATSVVLLLSLVALMFVLFKVIGGGSGGDQATLVKVPSLVGLTEATAVNLLQDADLKWDVERRADPIVVAGTVIESDPPAETEVEAQSLVKIVISNGQDQAQVPILVGISQAEAEQRLTDRGLIVGFVTNQPDPDILLGQVISQNPQAGDPVPVGSAVDLVVSGGPELYTLPDLHGRSFREVKLELEGLGFVVESEDAFDDELQEGLIVSSIPAPGDIKVGSTILLIVSIGPETKAVPSLIGRTVEDATQLAEGLGFEVVVSQETRENADLAGRIVEQTPDAGGLFPKGTKITVILAVAPTTTTTSTTTTSTTTTTTTPTTPPTTTVP